MSAPASARRQPLPAGKLPKVPDFGLLSGSEGGARGVLGSLASGQIRGVQKCFGDSPGGTPKLPR